MEVLTRKDPGQVTGNDTEIYEKNITETKLFIVTVKIEWKLTGNKKNIEPIQYGT